MFRAHLPGDHVVTAFNTLANLFGTEHYQWLTIERGLVISQSYRTNDDGEETTLVLIGEQLWWIETKALTSIDDVKKWQAPA